jgi:phosphoenolpyruvate carboxykinase (ATP)
MMDLSQYGIFGPEILRNPSVPTLYRLGMQVPSTALADSGAMIAMSNARTGRSPNDKRIVDDRENHDNIWWGNINIPISEEGFHVNRESATDFLGTRTRVFCVDAFAGWDPRYRTKIRIICARPYHALFMRNMLIRPTEQELADFGEPDWVIFNAGEFFSSTTTPGVSSKTSVCISFSEQQMVILGTEYAGEMKKGVFTVLNYTLPFQDVLPMHCSANEGPEGDTALFFGLSGTGKTTLSTDPKRHLIGDDEHGWSDQGIFNFEGGCYAKTARLSKEGEPDIWNAIRFGSVLENVVVDRESGVVDYNDTSITENTRTSYPIEFIHNAKIPCVGDHPRNIIFLTCDAFGVLPPVSRLTPEQAMFHFISGYTAKVAGTEVGVTEPQATFSACFGAAFMVWHPMVYAELLRKKLEDHAADAWLINTGWTGGPAGVGSRMKLAHTRSIVDAVLEGWLAEVPTEPDRVFKVLVPKSCPNVPAKVLRPREAWADPSAYDAAAAKLAGLFARNFEQFAEKAGPEVLAAAPELPEASLR